MKKKKLAIGMLSIFLIVIWASIYIHSNLLVINTEKKQLTNDVPSIGIIDGAIKKDYSFLKECNSKSYATYETHGDKMLSFLENFCSGVDVYYYNAEDENGDILTDEIINGLDWLKSKGVQYINISMSTKRSSNELENWIQGNAPSIHIFASYNNIMQSFDYPAMFDKVIGSGIYEQFMNLSKDTIYRTNHLFIWKAKKLYSGNSFLSLLTMVDFINSTRNY